MNAPDNTGITPVFDITAFEAADTALLEVMGINDEPLLGLGGLPVTIELYGPGSVQYAKATAKVDNANTARAMAAMRNKPQKDAAEEARRNHMEKLVACTKSVNNFLVSPADLYDNRKLGHITNQVAKFIEDWANFLPQSEKN